MSEHEQIESLHQRAAENYLQGQFEEALESWRQLLNLDPHDERAIEGIRLCELIVQQSSDSDFSAPAEDPVSRAMTLAPGEGSDVDFDEIASLLKVPEEPEPEAVEDPGWDFSALEAETPADGLDLADLPALGAEPATAEVGDGLDLPGLDLSQPEGPDDPGGTEVQTRIAELLSQASTSFDAGDVEGAMTLLDRVIELEPNNAAATALGQAFRSEIEARNEPQAGDGPAPDAVADDNLQPLGLSTSIGDAAEAAPPAVDESLLPTPPELAGEDGALDDLADLADAGRATAVDVAAPAKPAGSANRKRLLIGVGVVAALAAAGFLGLRMSRSDAKKPAPQTVQVRPVDGAAATDPTAVEVPQDVPNATTAAAPAGAAEAKPIDLVEVMARGREAFDAGEFSKAVVAYNEALQISPDSPTARRGLSRAAAAYKEQRAFMSKLDSASEAFARGDYREALRVFYRLPGTEGVARFDRFKANSWYNLGVNALKTGACRDATSHIREAGALLPGDTGIAAISELAKTCATSQSDVTWYGDVQRLTERTLED